MNPVGLLALKGGGDLLTSGFNAWANYAGSKKLMNHQFNLNKRMWQMQNEYNLPVNQMQRLSAAGLNPHLVYGNGGASATASIPQGVAQGHFNAGFNVDPLGDLASYQSILNQRASEDNTREMTRQAVLNGQKNRELIDAQIAATKAGALLTSENAYTQGLMNTAARVFTGNEQPRDIAVSGKSMFDRGAEAVGDLFWELSPTNWFYRSHRSNFGRHPKGAKLY